MLVSPAMLLALLLFSLIQAESPQLDPLTLQKIVKRSVNIHKSWGPSMNSPGAAVEIKEIYRRPGGGSNNRCLPRLCERCSARQELHADASGHRHRENQHDHGGRDLRQRWPRDLCGSSGDLR